MVLQFSCKLSVPSTRLVPGLTLPWVHTPDVLIPVHTRLHSTVVFFMFKK